MLSGKVYVVTSPGLITAVNRTSKALAFNPFIAQLGKRITGHGEATSKIVQHNLNGENGPGYVIEVHDGLVAALAPGKDLDNMTGEMLHEASRFLEDLETKDEVDLFAWMTHTVTMCSTRAIYGPDNPFNRSLGYVELFWFVIQYPCLLLIAHRTDRDSDCDLNMLITGISPSILAPKGHRARSILASAFQQYFERYDLKRSRASAMIDTRYINNNKHGVSFEDQGRLEVGTLLGVLANTIPSAFYMICRIYSDTQLLQAIRRELEMSCTTTSSESKICTLNISTMREKAHLLFNTFQKILRVHAMGAGSRYVREDVMLNNEYLLKKGMVIQMPMVIMHSDPRIWGPNVKDFRPQRFTKQAEAVEGSKSQTVAYRPFGGGASLCPGRHFVALEVMALAALMVLRFDLAPRSGHWHVPEQKQESLATNVFPPERDINVKVQRRKGFEDITWQFSMS